MAGRTTQSATEGVTGYAGSPFDISSGSPSAGRRHSWIADVTVVLAILAACWGPNAIYVDSHPVYLAEFLLIGGAALLAFEAIPWAKGRVNHGAVLAIGLLAVALIVAGGDVRQGMVVAVALPAASLLLAGHVSLTAWAVAASAGVLPLVRATLMEIANPAWWLASKFNEGGTFIGLSYVGGNRFLRVPATFPGPATAGMVEFGLAAIVLLAAARLKKGRFRSIARVAAVCALALALMTLTRSVITAIIVASLITLIGSSVPMRVRVALVLVGTTVLVLALGPLYVGITQDRSPLSTRTHFAQDALGVWDKSPLTGIGYGQLPHIVIDPLAGGPLYHAHFFPIQYLVELGPIGLAGILLLFLAIGRSAWGAPESRAVFIGLLLIAFLDVGILLYGRSAAVFWLVAGCAAQFPRMAEAAEKERLLEKNS